MKRRVFLRGVAAGIAVGSTTTGWAAGKPKPNILIYLSDDHSLRDCSVYGASDIPTPHMEQLAADGMKFMRAFIASPACAPSRAALLTGMTPAHNGAEANHSMPRKEIKKLPAYLQNLGYEVAAFGKVAHGARNAPYGFDHADGSRIVPQLRTAVVKYLEQRESDKPLALFVGTSNPHVGWPEETSFKPEEMILPETFVDTPMTRKYRTMYCEEIRELDLLLGDLRKLADKHLGRDTLFVYTSDHGAQWPFGKWNLYDDGIRTPFLAAWPGKIAPDSTTDAMVSWIDILPTLVEISGGKAPKEIDGRSFLGVLNGKTDKHRDVIYTTHSGDGNKNIYPIRAIRTDKWKFIINLHPEFVYTTHIDLVMSNTSCAYWGDWVEKAKTDPKAKAIVDRYYKRPKEELYYIDDDPLEQNNLADNPEHAATLKRLRKQLQGYMKEQGDQETVFNTPYSFDDPEPWKPGSGRKKPKGKAPKAKGKGKK